MTPLGKCPHCGQADQAEGANFCLRCGGALRGPPCPKCNASSEPGDRFCTQCGGPIPSRSSPGLNLGVQQLPWIISGLLMVAFVVSLATRGGSPEITLSPPPGQAGGLGPTASVDLGSMTPRQAADRLFARVMGSIEAGDRAQAEQFLPMAIASYDRIGALTLDDRFHLSLLHAAAGDGVSALSVAEAGLAVRPTHLLCLAAAAEAALLAADSAKAASYYQTYVDVYDEERQAGLTEYGTSEGGHANLLPVLRDEAVAHLAGGS